MKSCRKQRSAAVNWNAIGSNDCTNKKMSTLTTNVNKFWNLTKTKLERAISYYNYTKQSNNFIHTIHQHLFSLPQVPNTPSCISLERNLENKLITTKSERDTSSWKCPLKILEISCVNTLLQRYTTIFRFLTSIAKCLYVFTFFYRETQGREFLVSRYRERKREKERESFFYFFIFFFDTHTHTWSLDKSRKEFI